MADRNQPFHEGHEMKMDMGPGDAGVFLCRESVCQDPKVQWLAKQLEAKGRNGADILDHAWP